MSHDGTEPDGVDPRWVAAVRSALASLPYPVLMPDGVWDDAFVSDAQLVGGRLAQVAVSAVRDEEWVEVHSGAAGDLDVEDRLAEQGVPEVGEPGGVPGEVEVDGVPTPARTWVGAKGTVTLLDTRPGQDAVHVVTVHGPPAQATAPTPPLRTAGDLEPLLDAYLVHLGWEAP
ncbi:hypothetical protein [Thalassiella azotivora]